MTETATPKLALPLLLAAQAQKHVTHNEALLRLDATAQIAVLDRTLTAPPVSPGDGDAYLVATGATGDWVGRDGSLAVWASGWRFVTVAAGWLAYVVAEDAWIYHDGTVWQDAFVAAHNHVVADVAGLQSTLDGKLDNSGGTVTGDLTVNGNIGVGLTDPTIKLQVADNVTTESGPVASLSNYSNGSTATVNLSARTAAGVTRTGYWKIDPDLGVHGFTSLDDHTAAPALCLDAYGNVGIGTSNPEIWGPCRDLAIRGGTLQNGAAITLVDNDNSVRGGLYVLDSDQFVLGTYTADDVRLIADNTERARFSTAGYLLVGKTVENFGVTGFQINGSTGVTGITASDDVPLHINRRDGPEDGDLIHFWKDNLDRGSLSLVTTLGATPHFALDAAAGYGLLLRSDSGAFSYRPTANTGDHIHNFHSDVGGVFTQRGYIAADGSIVVGATSARSSTLYKEMSIQDANTVGIVINCTGGSGRQYELQTSTSGNFYLYDEAAAATRWLVDASGNVGIGTNSPASKLDIAGGRIRVRAGAGESAFLFENDDGAGYMWSGTDLTLTSGANATDAALYTTKDSTTSRSINAAGTVNASGADYAEYETKRDDCGTIVKGDLCGFDADGLLTDKWSLAVSFGIKSTDPSYVGGDVWGSEDALGLTRPEYPTRKEPVHETRDTGEFDENGVPIRENVMVEPGDSDAAFQAKLDLYDVEKTDFEGALAAARQRVDRIAYSGKVPLNHSGQNFDVGDYVVPVEGPSDSIKASFVAESDITFDLYRRGTGRVRAVLDDGRPLVAVKVG